MVSRHGGFEACGLFPGMMGKTQLILKNYFFEIGGSEMMMPGRDGVEAE